MEEKKIITYSLLAYFNNDSRGNGFTDIFIPLVKRTLSILSSNGRNMGQISDIKEEFENLYKLDIPYPMLKELLRSISIQISKSKSGSMRLYSDYSYVIEEYTFDDYEETIKSKSTKIKKLDEEFKKFVQENASTSQCDLNVDLFGFIDRNRMRLSELLSQTVSDSGNILEDADVEMDFIIYIKNNNIELYEILKEIYIGSIISAYIEVDDLYAKNEKMSFVVDTNFIVSLLGLHSEENVDTCQKIIEICNSLGYKLMIADITIDETIHILNKMIEENDSGLMEKCSNNSTQSICAKKNITKTDLHHMQRNLDNILSKSQISKIYLKQQYKNENIIKNSDIYKELEKINYVDRKSMLHDAILIDYVGNRRNKNAKRFSDIKIWFLTESKKFSGIKTKFDYPEAINTNELVNLLWLIKPIISTEDIINVGLSNLFAETIQYNQPSKRLIREIDSNIQKYKNNINDDDIIALGCIVSDSSINKIKTINSGYEELNDYLKDENFEEFSNKIREMKKISDEEKRRELQKSREKYQKEMKDKEHFYINIIINSKLEDYGNQIYEKECKKKELINKIEKFSSKASEVILSLIKKLIIVIGIVFTIYKNITNNKFSIVLIDVSIFAAPIIFAKVFNSNLLNLLNTIIKKIQRNQLNIVDEYVKEIKEIDEKRNVLYDFKEIVSKSKNIYNTLTELIQNEKFEVVIRELKLDLTICENVSKK